ncbi:ubiquitin-like-conjugating enzyme ATG10 isoform X1 [Polyodon spathula]|uniref:ubiquitin-like-conjugating enzyme ATG10 isoform X1 n=1 Tax=Polyodon spathula TaxID=7913 RepID=UPI001B7E2E53|nr:ubiquitin-like-conjugating enzyme ATG10 isoform X1 [Polyodon spathula]
MSRGWGSDEAVCLGEKAFRQCCEEFIQHSRSINDEWDWEHSQGSEEGYMKKILLKAENSSARPAWDGQRNLQGANGELELEAQHKVCEEFEDPAAGCSITTGPEVIRYEYHVVYSSSYQSPVLYFRACKLDGRPLSLEEIWERVHDNYKDRLLQGPWDTITQQEHPLLGQPFFILHPCRTHEFMSPIVQAAKQENRHLNVITAWLSMVGPVVGLALPISYAMAASKHKPAPD